MSAILIVTFAVVLRIWSSPSLFFPLSVKVLNQQNLVFVLKLKTKLLTLSLFLV